MSPQPWQLDARRPGVWRGVSVCVAGLGIVGSSAAAVLRRLGAAVTVVDDAAGDRQRATATALVDSGIRVQLGGAGSLPEGTDLLVVSPGFRPDAPVVAAAGAAGVPAWGDVELAWRLRPEPPAPWLCVTGTNGKTTTVRMLTAMLEAAGRRVVAAGNIGLALLDAVSADPPYDVLPVELSSFQLHYTESLRPLAAALLNLAPDHLDWHGGMAAYVADKARVVHGATVAVYNADDPKPARIVREQAGGARLVGFTLGRPGPGELGVAGGRLVDRAFGPPGPTGLSGPTDPTRPTDSTDRIGPGGPGGAAAVDTELAVVGDVVPAAPHNVANALAAAALARAYGVRPAAVRDGLRRFRPDGHRLATVATIDGVRYVDDSKATNGHAAAAAVRSFDSVVWIAGGLAKGAAFDDLAVLARPRLRAVVLLGRDRAVLRDALRRHAPEVPMVEVADVDTGAMTVAVGEAARLARPGDTVLLAPACASMDMFADYRARGDGFADAVRRLAALTAPQGSL